MYVNKTRDVIGSKDTKFFHYNCAEKLSNTAPLYITERTTVFGKRISELHYK